MNANPIPWRAALLALVLGAVGLTSVPTAFGQANANPPERMTYQGFLVDGNGTPLGNSNPKNYDVVFRIWSSENGTTSGDRLWTEQQTVTVDKGYFSVMLGEGTAVGGEARPALSTLFKGATASERWVGITVKGLGGTSDSNTDILPRLRLLTSPYAYLATQATKLVRSDNSNDLLASSGNTLTLNGALEINGSHTLEFGAGVNGKEGSAGKIGYATFSNGSLDIVGAGTSVDSRKVKVWADGGTTFTGPVTATSFEGAHYGSGDNLTGVAKLAANIFTGLQEVQNHVVVGDSAGSGNTAGWGEALILRGAPPLSPGWNSENSDPIWFARYNAAANSSELRAVIGDDPGSTGDKFVIGTMQGSGNFSQSATFAPRVTVDARGFLGVGGRNPDYLLHFPNALGDKITLWGDGAANHYGFGIDNSTLLIHSDGPGSATSIGYGRYGSYTETARIDSNGWISMKGGGFQVVRNGEYANFYRDGNNLILELNGSLHNAGWRYALYDGDSNWDFGSDRRLKKDIVDAPPVLDRALKVQVRNFRWKESSEDTKPMIGVVAQELQPLFPDMVTETDDPRTGEKTLMVGYGDFAVIAIKAIQEMKAQHDKELEQLKSQIADLKSQMKDVLQAAAELRESSATARSTAAVNR